MGPGEAISSKKPTLKNLETLSLERFKAYERNKGLFTFKPQRPYQTKSQISGELLIFSWVKSKARKSADKPWFLREIILVNLGCRQFAYLCNGNVYYALYQTRLFLKMSRHLPIIDLYTEKKTQVVVML